MEVLDNSTVASKELRIFLQAISCAAHIKELLGQVWELTEQIIPLPPNTSFVKIEQDKSILVGMNFIEERLLPVKYNIYVNIIGENNPYLGGWLLVFAFDLETKAFHYWITEMATVYQRGLDYDFTQASKLGRIGFFNASGRGGVGITSTNN
jgi:hypothetical protein